jgi:hypothetical protein
VEGKIKMDVLEIRTGGATGLGWFRIGSDGGVLCKR